MSVFLQPLEQRCRENIRDHRFADMRVHTSSQTAVAIFVESIGCHAQDREVAQTGEPTNGARRLQSVHDRHLDSTQDQVLGAVAPGLEGQPAVRDGVDLQAQRAHHRGQDLLVGGIVLGGQQAQGAFLGVVTLGRGGGDGLDGEAPLQG